MRVFKIILISFIIFSTAEETIGQCSDTETLKFTDELSRELRKPMNPPSKQDDICLYYINLPENHSFEMINKKVNGLVNRFSDVSLEMNWVEKSDEKGPVYSSALKIGDEWTVVNYRLGVGVIELLYFIQKNVRSADNFTTITYKGEEYIEYTLENLIFIHDLSGSSLESKMSELGLEGSNFRGNVSYMAVNTFGKTKVNEIIFNEGTRKLLIYQSNTGNFPPSLENSFDKLKRSLKDNFIGTASNGDSIYRILVGNQNYAIGLNKTDGQISAGIKSQ